MPRSPRIKGLSLKDFAILVSDYLRRNGIETLLSGGACVAIYTKNKYMSFDLDLVLAASDDYRNAKQAMEAIGFDQKGRYFVHKDSRFFIDFVSPPASLDAHISADILDRIFPNGGGSRETIRERQGMLRLEAGRFHDVIERIIDHADRQPGQDDAQEIFGGAITALSGQAEL